MTNYIGPDGLRKQRNVVILPASGKGSMNSQA